MSQPRNKILIVDDSREDRELLKGILEYADPAYEVWTVNSGKMALALIEQDPPDLILLDIHMAETNGFETLTEMKRRGHDIAVLLVSSFTEAEDRTKGIECGAKDFIDKPIQAEAVKARVAVHLKMNKLENKAGVISSSPERFLKASPAEVTEEQNSLKNYHNLKSFLATQLLREFHQPLLQCAESLKKINQGTSGVISEELRSQIVRMEETLNRLLQSLTNFVKLADSAAEPLDKGENDGKK